MGVRKESTLGFAVVVSSLQIFADMETRERGVGSGSCGTGMGSGDWGMGTMRSKEYFEGCVN